MRVLIAEHDGALAARIQAEVGARGMVVDAASNGEAALRLARARRYGAIVMDAELPGLGGIEACRRLREREIWSPVLILTAGNRSADQIAGFDAGADDCLARPFVLAELTARLRAIVRRGAPDRPPVLRVGDLALDPASHRCHRGDVAIGLSGREYALLHVLMTHAGQVLDRAELLEQVWGADHGKRSNLVDVYVNYLRRKVDRPFGTSAIETVRGIGYRVRADGGRS